MAAANQRSDLFLYMAVLCSILIFQYGEHNMVVVVLGYNVLGLVHAEAMHALQLHNAMYARMYAKPLLWPFCLGEEPWRSFGIMVNDRPMLAAADVNRVQAVQHAYWRNTRSCELTPVHCTLDLHCDMRRLLHVILDYVGACSLTSTVHFRTRWCSGYQGSVA